MSKECIWNIEKLKLIAIFAAGKKDIKMLEKKNKNLEPEIGGPVTFALFILALVVLIIWMAS